jgi:hypothetical protein
MAKPSARIQTLPDGIKLDENRWEPLSGLGPGKKSAMCELRLWTALGSNQ